MTRPGPPTPIRLLITLLVVVLLPACDRSPAGDVLPPADETRQQAAERRAATITPKADEALDPALAPFYVLIKERKTGPARVRLAKHLKLHPEDGMATFLFGLSYHREKKYQIAHEHFTRAAELAPDEPAIYYFDAWSLFYLGDLEGSRAQFTINLAFQPDKADSHFGVGLIDLEEGRFDDAEARFRGAIALWEKKPGADRDLAKAYARLGDVFAQRNELAEARAALEKAIALHDLHYEAHYKLYRVLVRLGEDEAADAALARHHEIKQRVRPGTAFPE